MNTPIKERKNVTIPIIIIGVIIEICKNEKLIPTASASILVAIASNKKSVDVKGICFYFI